MSATPGVYRNAIWANSAATGCNTIVTATWPFVAAAGLITLQQSAFLLTIGLTCSLLAVLPAGVVADRYHRGTILRFQATTTAVCVTACLAGIAANANTFVACTVMASTLGALSALSGPTVSGLLKELAPPARLAEARASLQVTTRTAQVIGAPLAGALCAVTWALSFLAVLIAAILQFAFAKRIPQASARPRPRSQGSSALQDFATGLSYMWRNRLLRAFALFASFGNLSSMLVLTLVNLALIHQETPVAVIGFVGGLAVAATIAGGLLAPTLLRRFTPWQLCLGSTLFSAATLLPLLWWPDVPLITLCLCLSRITQPAAAASVGGYVMHAVPDEFQGRVAAAITVIAIALQPLAPLVAESAVSTSIHATAIVVSIGALVVSAFSLTISHTFRDVGLPETWGEPHPQPH